MLRGKRFIATAASLCLLALPALMPVAANGAETVGGCSLCECADDYSAEVSGDSFSFCDRIHGITISSGSLKDGRDISYYGLSDDGSLATVYFNTEADEGKGVLISDNSMRYITYKGGKAYETARDTGTVSLFGFNMENADSSLDGMMKVFSASLASFLGSYSAAVSDYSSVCSSFKPSGNVGYLKSTRTSLTLVDDNFITSPDGSAGETFLANEWGIYSGYQVIGGVDYNTFCFFGDNNDVYYYGYSAGGGQNVLAMKGTVSDVSSRTKNIQLSPVDLTKASDSASQYITKMSGLLKKAQGAESMNLDTLKLSLAVKWYGFFPVTVMQASTSSAYGTLYFSDGAFSGTLTDCNGNSENISVTASGRNFIVSAQNTGIFTVASCGSSGSLAASNPSYQKYYRHCFVPKYCGCFNWGLLRGYGCGWYTLWF